MNLTLKLPRFFLSLSFFVSLTALLFAQTNDYDLLIKNGKIYDGTGNPWFYADVAVSNGKIVSVGKLEGAKAARTIDAGGKIVVPGFIDIHSHADDGARPQGGLRDNDPKRRAAPNIVMQGVTTVVVNQDGRSPWPINQQASQLFEKGVGPNAALLFGHGTIRLRVMKKDFRRAATESEIAKMRELAKQAMDEGALGMSAGLEYIPGRWSTTDEVVAIAQEIAAYNGVYISHQRSEGTDPMWFWPTRHDPGAPTLLDAVMETIEVSERSGVTAVCSHIKTKGAHFWGASGAAIQLIEAARARGVNVWADQYPYNTSGTDGNTTLIPYWIFDSENQFYMPRQRDQQVNYAEKLRAKLNDEAEITKLERDIAHEIRRRGGAENVVVFDYPDSSLIGKSLAELAQMRNQSPIEMAITLQLEGFPKRRGGARLRGFSMSEIDVEAYGAKPWVMTCSDGGIAMPGDGPVHARFYGTFPRKIRHYALNRGVISVENAIRSMTSLPAQVLGLRDRGMIREGFWADITVIDLENLRDAATFENPHQYAEGVEHVFVNGKIVVENSELTWALPGVVLRNKKHHSEQATASE